MTMKKKAISVLSTVVLGALLVAARPTAAFASESAVTTPEAADAMAQHYREQAAHYRALGGTAWKTGLVQRSDGDAAKYAALAEQLRAPAAAARSPEAEHYAQLAAYYRAMGGGAAYKSGRVQWAEAQQRKYEAAPVTASTPSPSTSWACAGASKPVVRTLACAR